MDVCLFVCLSVCSNHLTPKSIVNSLWCGQFLALCNAFPSLDPPLWSFNGTVLCISWKLAGFISDWDCARSFVF